MTPERETDQPARRLRIAVLGDFDSVHTGSWLRWFIERGHDMHAISFYPPATPIEGATLHVLRAALRTDGAVADERGRGLIERAPRGIVRLAQAMRYRSAGLAGVVRQIAPDVLHAHYLVEHGFYGATIRFHPYVITCWGSDVLVEPRRDPVSRLIARWTIGRADMLTSNNRYMAERLIALGGSRDHVEVITLGADRFFMDGIDASVNVGTSATRPVVLSTRAHERLYNVGEIIDAFARVHASRRDARLVIAHGGSLTGELRQQANALGGAVDFAGFVEREQLRDAMHAAEVFVSVPDSDGTSVALLQAMASGCFPIVSDLPSQRELVEDGVNGLRVPLHRPDLLASAIERAIGDAELRRRAVGVNRGIVEERGLNEHEMRKMEAVYARLCRGSLVDGE